MDRRSRSVLSGDQRTRHLRSGRCPSSISQRRHLRCRRRRHSRETGPPVPRPPVTTNPRELQEARSTQLYPCQTVAREIFRSAANRMRNLEGYSQQREKLISLGTMAAGLAHELNNPAAAARRAAAHMQQTTDKVQSYLCQLSKTLEPEHWQYL